MVKPRHRVCALLLLLGLVGGNLTWSFYNSLGSGLHDPVEVESLDCLRKGRGCRAQGTLQTSENVVTEEPAVHIETKVMKSSREAKWDLPALPPLRDVNKPCPDKYLTVNTHTWGRHHNQLQSVIHGLLMARLLGRTFILGHFRHAKAWHDVRDFYSFEELGRYFCIAEMADVAAKLKHEKSIACFGQDIHDMPIGKHLHLKCDPKAHFPKSFPIPGFKTVIQDVVPKLAAAAHRIINLSGELAFFLRPGLPYMAVGYGLLRPSAAVRDEVQRFTEATFKGQDYIAIHLRYREGTCAAEIETDFVQNFNITGKLVC
eukprot:TRINITY_DN25560_c0_g1_i2.p1 TRINITY_DN25560_c0_g1~~TRINITY_DN25560_c0_g1_i2.p1  ORF type:complete len:349 (+),score=46.55 TRINITY_DN25560_c0_g1_i2:100-1047(+)